MKVFTNHKPRPILSWYELTEKEKKEFDYIENPDEDGFDRFFRYKGNCYDVQEFTVAPEDLKPWQGIAPDSYFSGTVIKFTNDYEEVIVGWYCC